LTTDSFTSRTLNNNNNNNDNNDRSFGDNYTWKTRETALAGLAERLAQRPALLQPTTATTGTAIAAAAAATRTTTIGEAEEEDALAPALDGAAFALHQPPLLVERRRLAVAPFGWRRATLAGQHSCSFALPADMQSRVLSGWRVVLRSFAAHTASDYIWQHKNLLSVNAMLVDISVVRLSLVLSFFLAHVARTPSSHLWFCSV
jgi:hypothetical protein